MRRRGQEDGRFGIVGNGTDGCTGRSIRPRAGGSPTWRRVFEQQGSRHGGLTPNDLITNEFLDKSIKLDAR
jgi:hypothetical protein